MEKAGDERWNPLSEKEYDKKYPNYSIINVDGIDEVFEQKQAEKEIKGSTIDMGHNKIMKKLKGICPVSRVYP